ncbi:uncharacterized protein N7506_012161 [Penicillium brevicompactum]|uniref:uncharacterized protein n=1 Tax=Penicillium brevicompactum TaxID=5074 RepID=UPI00254195D7|nr:uncharacterized protein N7506_012161 [Penicillium brevicompactum]KAJ5319457.1 hypothetical protein N7506_012161 [Penicillium brevicompactum]
MVFRPSIFEDQDFHDAGYKEWSIKHAWFADMGGFLITYPGEDMPSFPVDAKQLCSLVKDGYLPYPELDEDEIEDKSKSSGLAKLFTIAQACWFTFNTIFRFAQGLVVTTLEITTLSFILVFLVTSFCWYHKPMDVNRPITLELTASVAAIRGKYHQNPGPQWYETPFEFLSRDEWFISRFWKYYIQILHYLHIPLFIRPERRPYDRIPSHYGPNVDFRAEIVCAPTVLLFSSVFLIAWNTDFPTTAEQILWRFSSASMVAFTLFGGLAALYFHKTIFKADIAQQKTHAIQNKEGSSWIYRFLSKLKNIDPEQDPALEIPLRALIPISLVCVLYAVGRVFILTEDLIGLRSLPKSAFETVSWSKYIPHW